MADIWSVKDFVKRVDRIQIGRDGSGCYLFASDALHDEEVCVFSAGSSAITRKCKREYLE
jgi:hypothetical protein